MRSSRDLRPDQPRIFLLSPATCSGKRATQLVHPDAKFDLALRVQSDGAPLAEVFAFLSSLYFRGKVAYANRFARPPRGLRGAHVITSNQGLLPLETMVTRRDLLAFDEVEIDPLEPRYTGPVRDTARAVARALPPETEVVLLGSVASNKYTQILLPIFAERLLFPRAFAGLGDMSRGGLMLRRTRSGRELRYVRIIRP
jgi:hypothetical protein